MHLCQESLTATFEERLQTADVPFVILFGDPQIARCRALLNRCEQTRSKPLPTRIAWIDIQRASPETKHALHDLECTAKLAGAGEGSIEFGPLGLGRTSHFDPRIVLVGRDHQIRKGLVVLEIFVVPGLDVFDESVFRQQRIDLAGALHVVDVGDFVDPLGGSGFLLGCGLKVTAGPRPQILGLADINHHPRGILHQVNPWRLGKLLDFLGRFAKSKISGQGV